MIAPGLATATIWPAATFGAPQTIVDVEPPTSTSQTVSRSASGCLSADKTRPTTNSDTSPTPPRWSASTFVPVIVRRSARSAADRPDLQYASIQLYGALIGTAPRSAGR